MSIEELKVKVEEFPQIFTVLNLFASYWIRNLTSTKPKYNSNKEGVEPNFRIWSKNEEVTK